MASGALDDNVTRSELDPAMVEAELDPSAQDDAVVDGVCGVPSLVTAVSGLHGIASTPTTDVVDNRAFSRGVRTTRRIEGSNSDNRTTLRGNQGQIAGDRINEGGGRQRRRLERRRR